MLVARYTNIIACPECKGNIREIEVNHQVLGFFCESCKLIYPVKEGILILLPQGARNYAVEYDLVQNIRRGILEHHIEGVEQHINNTLNLLKSSKDVKSWEWEDEEFWSKEYKKEGETVVHKNWNDRIWQREFLVKQLLNETKLDGRVILDVGCGEGQNFRLLLSKYCDESSLYIAADISWEGLNLNRSRNTHNNSLYILCSADKLPFHRETIDILCYFGILHHTERKADTISQDSDLVKKGGYILIHEALDRPTISSLIPSFLKRKVEQSAHEERINKKKLLSQIINNNNLEIITSRNMHTIFFGAMMRFLRKVMITNKAFFCLVCNLDVLFVRLNCGIVPFFREGEIMALVRRF